MVGMTGSAIGMKCAICQKLNEIGSAKLGESPHHQFIHCQRIRYFLS
jgi:hypothetical protein